MFPSSWIALHRRVLRAGSFLLELVTEACLAPGGSVSGSCVDEGGGSPVSVSLTLLSPHF